MVFLGAVLAELAGIEAIIGAFLSGLALNRLIPHTSPLMNRIEFVGNAIFIPFFLIGVGMLIDYRVFFNDIETIKVAAVMIIVATSAKFLAAWITQKTFKFSADERRLIFGLSNAQAAATLAAVLVGYNIITGENASGEPIRLLNESVLNGTILMILFTCTIASFVAQKGAKNIALLESSDADSEELINTERVLIPISNSETIDELINLGITVKSKKNKEGLFALSIVDNSTTDASAGKNAQKITDLILGLHISKGISESFLGNLTEGILTKCNTTTLIYKPAQPFNTIKRHLIIVPENSEKDMGFPFWIIKIWNIARNSGAKLVFYANKETLLFIKQLQAKQSIECEFEEFSDWDDFLILAKNFYQDDNLIIVLSRKDEPSYNKNMSKIPSYLNRYFKDNSYILIYPMQASYQNASKIDYKNPTLLAPLEKLDELRKSIAKKFKWW